MSLNSYLVDKITPVLEAVGIPWPGGDPEALRNIAGQWRTFAVDLHETAEHLNGRVDGVVGVTWHGAAADAFKKHWDEQYKALQNTSKNFVEVQKQLDAYADEAEAIVKEIVEIALEILEMEVAGALLSVFTAGIAEAVTTGVAAQRAARIVSLVEKFSKLAKSLETSVLNFVKGSKTLTRLIKGLIALVREGLKNTAMNYAGTVGTKLATGDKDQGFGLGWQDLQNAALAGGMAATPKGLGTALGSLGRHGAPNVFEKVLAGDGLNGGAKTAQSMVSGSINSAGGTLFAEQFDPTATTVGADTATSAVTGALGAGFATRNPVAGKNPRLKRDWEGGEHPHMRSGWEIGANGTVYAGGGAVETTAKEGPNKLVPDAGSAVTDKDGAVDLPDA